MKRIIAVYDVDPFYADRFADFANEKEQTPFTVMAFNSFEKLEKFSNDHVVEILLINSDTEEELVSRIRAVQVIRLVDGGAAVCEKGQPTVYKYQPADSIIREVMAYYCGQPMEQPYVLTGKKASVIGVYSPVNRCQKTSFCLALGGCMSRDAKVIYVNLEECSGFSRLVEGSGKGDLSDLLYFYRREGFHCLRLGALTHSLGELDYIPPVRFGEDLCQVEAEEIASLIAQIASGSAYDVVIVDVGQFGRSAAVILETCDIVYMPVKEDVMSCAKTDEFMEYLEVTGREELARRIQKLKLPPSRYLAVRQDNYLEKLLWSELGDFVRQLQKGGQHPWKS